MAIFKKTYVLSEHYPLPYIKAETVKYLGCFSFEKWLVIVLAGYILLICGGFLSCGKIEYFERLSSFFGRNIFI